MLAEVRASVLGRARDLDGLSDEQRLETLHQIELLGRAAAGVGARLQTAFRTSQVRAQLADGVRPSRAGLAVGDDLALARLTSPYWGRRELTSARALVEQMPRTLAALEEGTISPYQARQVTELTTCLSREDRDEVDARLVDVLPGIAPGDLTRTVRALVYEIDPQGFVGRARKAAADRGVSLRAAPDVMGILTARLPAPQAIAAFQSLQAAARVKKAGGDPRTLNQLMADELYERLTGRLVVDGIDVEVGVVITDTALFAGTSDPAELIGYGPVPAELARDLLRPTPQTSGQPDPDEEPAGESDPPEGHADPSPGPVADLAPTPRPFPTDGPDGTPEQEMVEQEMVEQARADAQANAAGYPGGHVPDGHCPAGPRCTDFSCSLVHGVAGPGGAGDGPGSTVESVPTSDTKDAPAAPTEKAGSVALRDITTGAQAAKVWIRRLFTDPVTGVLVQQDPRRRVFTGVLRAFLIARDRTCRNAWCGAPVRHIDHITRHADGGLTDEANGRGLCARCNLAREHPRHFAPPPETYRPPPPLLPIFPRVPGGP